MSYSPEHIAKITNGICLKNVTIEVSHFIIDSRTHHVSDQTLFFALVGPNHNANNYIKVLYQRGVRVFVVQEVPKENYPNAGFILVKNAKKSLQKFAVYHRKQFQIPIIAITGSNGKTTIKEWIAASLNDKENIVKTPGSQNSQVGVPLSILQVNKHHSLGIFEAGISKVGEMDSLHEIIKPTVGILTNIGSAHDSGFLNRSAKIKEKVTLFKNASYVICDEKYQGYIAEDCFTYGESSYCNLHFKKHLDKITITYKGEKVDYLLTENTDAFLNNTLTFCAYHLSTGVPIFEIPNYLKKIPKKEAHLEIKNGIRAITLIDDSYNNDIEGLLRAFEILEQEEDSKSFIISAFNNSKENSRLLSYLRQRNYKYKITIGVNQLSLPEVVHFDSVEDFLNSDAFIQIEKTTLLLKGSSNLNFNKITTKLQEQHHTTVFEIDLQALQHNLNEFRSLLQPKTKIMLMVKAFGYGTEAGTIAKLAEYNNIEYLGVAYLDEGIKLRQSGVLTPIMVMNPNLEQLNPYLEYNLEPEIYSIATLRKISSVSVPLQIHLKIDTGMHRLGFEELDIPFLLHYLKENKNIKVTSIFSHLATADNEQENSFTERQLHTFNDLSSQIRQDLSNDPILHILNSHGIINQNQHQKDMVRLGIGLYGGISNKKVELKSVGTLKTTVSQIKLVQKGESIGYARSGKTNKKSKIATIAIGYADGYDRRFGNGVGTVIINNQKAHTIGNICMDMTMVDVTGLEVKEGDPVFIINQQQSIFDLAKQIDTIPYEILTNISSRVVRSKIKK